MRRSWLWPCSSGAGALHALPQEARYFIAPLPLPVASEAYARKFAEHMGEHGRQGLAQDLLAAQMLRDATMAHAIARLRPAVRMVVVTLETQEVAPYRPEGNQDPRDFVILRAAPVDTPPTGGPQSPAP